MQDTAALCLRDDLVERGGFFFFDGFLDRKNTNGDRACAEGNGDLIPYLHIVGCLDDTTVHRNVRSVARVIGDGATLDDPGNL